MSKQVNLYEAKTNLSRLVEEAAAGEEIVIAKNGRAKARLVPAADTKPKLRVGGQWARFLTPEEKKDWGSAEWWRRWKEADAEIERDFELGLKEDWKEIPCPMADYLIDSNAFLNFKTEPQKLRPQARETIENGENRLYVSLAGLWELAIKAANGKLEAFGRMIAFGPDVLLGALRESRFDLLPIDLSHALSASQLPQHHRDPFDRLMIAQAQAQDLVIVTADAIFSRYDVRVLRA